MINQKFYSECENDIRNSYEEGVTISQAETLASKFLHALILVSEELREADLDARMKKSGLKAIQSAVYMEAATKDTKKPSDTFLDALVSQNEVVLGQQESYYKAEVDLGRLKSLYEIFKEAHVHFRGIAKGRYEA